MKRRRATMEMFFGEQSFGKTVSGFYFVEIHCHAPLLPGHPQKKILQGKVVQHDDAGPVVHGRVDARVVAIVVAEVIEDGVIVRQTPEQPRMSLIIKNPKVAQQLRIVGMKTIDEEVDVEISAEMRQQFFAVI